MSEEIRAREANMIEDQLLSAVERNGESIELLLLDLEPVFNDRERRIKIRLGITDQSLDWVQFNRQIHGRKYSWSFRNS